MNLRKAVRKVALLGPGTMFIGSITTPVQGGYQTTGNNDGGTGAQSGMVYRLSMSQTESLNTNGAGTSVTNPSYAIDGDQTTYAVVQIDLPGGSSSTSSCWLQCYGPPGIVAASAQTLVVYILMSVPVVNVVSGTPNPTWFINCWNINSNPTNSADWTFLGSFVLKPSGSEQIQANEIFGSNQFTTPTLCSVELPGTTNPSQVLIELGVDGNDPGGTTAVYQITMYVYEIWIECLA